MTYQSDYTLPSEFLSQIAEQGLDILPELIRIVINEAMHVERQRFLGVGPYERSPQRRGHANGYKPKTVATRMGKITFDIPQVRQGGFYPQSLEKGLRSERALGPGRDVCTGYLHPQSRSHYGKAVWLRGLLQSGQPGG